MAQVFERLGYDIIHNVDCLAKDYMELLEEFEERIGAYDASIIYSISRGTVDFNVFYGSAPKRWNSWEIGRCGM